MTVGIISMQKVVNYGSFLQAYALKHTIENLGHQVRFVDIHIGEQLVQPKHSSYPKLGMDKYLLKRIEHVLFKKNRDRLFKKVYFPMIGINQPTEEADCDTLVIGSDEVFNCCQPSRWGFSTQLFGDTQKPTISYAASCGATTIEGLQCLGKEKAVTSALKKMKAISVRDSNTSSFVNNLTGRVPIQHLDPVLVYDWTDEVPELTRFKNYILVYAYDNRISDEKEIAAIKAFAKMENKILISFGVYQRWCDKNVVCSPLELIAYFDGADYIITDTFHGTVISIKRNKQFVTFIRKSNKYKLMDLLHKFNLEEYSVNNAEEISYKLKCKIDYTKVNSILDAEKKRTLEYLRDQL